LGGDRSRQVRRQQFDDHPSSERHIFGGEQPALPAGGELALNPVCVAERVLEAGRQLRVVFHGRPRTYRYFFFAALRVGDRDAVEAALGAALREALRSTLVGANWGAGSPRSHALTSAAWIWWSTSCHACSTRPSVPISTLVRTTPM